MTGTFETYKTFRGHHTSLWNMDKDFGMDESVVLVLLGIYFMNH
jgi:hypothetical protein